jgi:predicted permease
MLTLMRMSHVVRLRLRSLFRRSDVERDLRDEFDFYLEQRMQREIEKGASRAEALAIARRALGGEAQRMESCRDHRGVGFIENFVRDIRVGVRAWLRTRALWALTTITLGLGLGANSTIFSLVDVIYHQPLAGLDPDRHTVLEAINDQQVRRGNSLEEFLAWKQAGIFPMIVATRGVDRVLIGLGEPEPIHGLLISADFFTLFPGPPALGRYPNPAEFENPANRVMVLSYAAWRGRFGGRPDVIGQTVRLDDATYTIIGVAPQPFWFSDTTARFWAPVNLTQGPRSATQRDYQVIARLPEGATRATVAQALIPIQKDLERRFPDSHAGWRIQARSLFESFYGPGDEATIRILFLISAGVLVVCCANVANLLLARSLTRQREMSVRAALGAGRSRLFAQSLSEGTLLALPAALFALAATQASSSLLFHFMQLPFPIPNNFLDTRVLAVNVGAALLSVFIFGFYPAMVASRADASLETASRRAAFGRGTRRFTRGLVALQAAGGLALVIAALIGLKGTRNILALNYGYDHTNVFRLPLNPSAAGFPAEADYMRYYRQILTELESAPVESFGLTSSVPGILRGDGASVQITTSSRRLPKRERPVGRYVAMTAGALRTLKLPVSLGRSLHDSDTAETQRVALVNQQLCDKLFPGRDPLAESLVVDEFGPEPFRVVGVYPNLLPANIRNAPPPQFVVPFWQVPARSILLIGRSADPAGSIEPVRRALRAVDPEVPIQARTLREDIASDYGNGVVFGNFVAVLAALALFLAGCGLFAVLSQSVTQRLPEIGIRIALGATPASLQRLVFASGLGTLAFGGALGLGGGIALGRMLAALITRVDPLDPGILVPSLLAFLFVAAVAVLVPARRIASSNALSLLRQD